MDIIRLIATFNLVVALSVLCSAENYKLTQSSGVVRLSDNATIPMNTENRDWVDYRKWVRLGNTPLPADPAIIDPAIRKALFDVKSSTATMTTKVNALIMILGFDK